MGNSKAKLSEVLIDSTNEAKLKAAFQSYDKDGSGFIDREEAKHFAKDLLKIAEKQLKTPRKDILTPNISLEEYFDKNFSIMDRDGSGQVSYEEFKDFLQKYA
eukprot:TRINITY_DN3061_c0_g1_i3.p1 TRINITY_DN3061_c0_g1~~TRINITY_DN3061_c0_g1_i3.p1  ORF type:complete len:103 (+),score=24.23 TRINITY_DN3061_c0_g1_i3:119-427(+)